MKRLGVAVILLVGAIVLMAQSNPSPADAEATPQKSSAAARALRRLFDGAPPTIPHPNMGADCIQCHNERGMAVEGVGFSPPSPHDKTQGLSAVSHCVQCHVYKATDGVFRENTFVGLKQDLRKGRRLHPFSPPVMPHKLLMRENCAACHTGPAARESIRTSHPERIQCRQCHVAQVSRATFSR